MKKILYLTSLVLVTILVLVACGKKTEKKEETPSDRAKADAVILLDTILGKSSNGFSKLYGANYETWSETEVFEDLVKETIEDKGYTPEADYTFVYIEGIDAKTPTQVLTKFYTTRRDMIAKIQDYKLKNVKVEGDEATVTFTSRSINTTAAGVTIRNLLLTLYDGDINVLFRWNQADRNDDEKAKAKELTSRFLYGENFSGNLRQFDNINRDTHYTPLTGADDLEKTFKMTKDSSGHWTISSDDYTQLIMDLNDVNERSGQAVYAERIHKNLSDYQPETKGSSEGN